MQGKIFLLDRRRKLVPLEESAYDSEDLLQTLLADDPNLLAGDKVHLDPLRDTLVLAWSGSRAP